MSLLPRSLFGRLMVLLVTVVALAAVTTILLFNRDRAALLARQFNDTKLVQMKALRAALEGADGPMRRETLARLGREYGVRIIAESERPTIGVAPLGAAMQGLQERLREGLGEGTDVRIARRSQQLYVRVQAGDDGYWIGFPLPRPQPDDIPTRALTLAIAIIVLLLLAAFAFARYLARPLLELRNAVERVGRGETPPALPESGTSEIAAVNRGFNAMLANLRQIERDRAILLAGVSHDLRTPLARLRLGVELHDDDPAARAGMVADIEEMDRIIDQFLDFARDEAASTAVDPVDIHREIALCVDRYTRSGNEIRLAPGPEALVRIKPTAVWRIASNLIDNALAYGRPPLEVSTARQGSEVTVDVADRGAGIPPADVERLKQPFTRAGEARSRDDGAAGAGLGLAIVDRIARRHGGRFDLLPREGGGTIARVTLPAAA